MRSKKDCLEGASLSLYWEFTQGKAGEMSIFLGVMIPLPSERLFI